MWDLRGIKCLTSLCLHRLCWRGYWAGDGEFKNAPLLKEWQRWIRGKQPGQANCPTYHSAENKVLLVGHRCCRDVELREYLWFAKIRGELGEDIRTGMPVSSLFSDALLHVHLLYAMLFLNGKTTKNKKSARWIGWSGAFLFWKRWSWSWNFCSSPAYGQQQCCTVLTVSITVFIVGNKCHSQKNITGKK